VLKNKFNFTSAVIRSIDLLVPSERGFILPLFYQRYLLGIRDYGNIV